MNVLSCNSENVTRQPHQKHSLPLQDPLKQAAIANGSLKINLRQFRRNLSGPAKVSAVSRLLDASDAIGRALEWLRATEVPGGLRATDDSLGPAEQFAIEPRTTAEAIGVSQ